MIKRDNVSIAIAFALAFSAGALFAVHASAADGPKLSPAEMRALYKAADLKQIKGAWVNSCGEPAPDKAEVVDLNGKGKPGVFLYVTGSCLHWEGSHFKLYIKSKDGRWMDALGVAARRYAFLPARHNGYFDVQVLNEATSASGPGSIYCWNGQRYIYESLKRCGR
jgi:hypothetical protein